MTITTVKTHLGREDVAWQECIEAAETYERETESGGLVEVVLVPDMHDGKGRLVIGQMLVKALDNNSTVLHCFGYPLFSVSATPIVFYPAGGTGTATVTGPNSAWTAVSNDAWITITSGASGSGNGTVDYSIAEFSPPTSRTGTMTIAGQTVTITQYGPV